MFKSIALMGAAVGLVVSMTSAQAAIQGNGVQLNALTVNGVGINGVMLNSLISNSLTANGASQNALAGFAVEWIELPDGTVATH